MENTTIFLSYSTKNSFLAQIVRENLKKNNIEVWMDRYKIEAGTQWRNEIDLGIIESSVLLLIITPASCLSSYVTYEWAFALGKNKIVIPLLFEDADIHPRSTVLEYMDFRNADSAPWEQLFILINKYSDKLATEETDTNLVGALTVKQFGEMMVATLSLMNANAKTEGRVAVEGDISQAVKNITDAKFNLDQSSKGIKTILWVDDRPSNNNYERETLSSLGFKFELALSTKDALEKLSVMRYDAIISDMGRVEGPKEGYVLLEAVRKTDKATPYFIYAGSNNLEHKLETERLGGQGCTNNPNELIEMVTKYVSIK